MNLNGRLRALTKQWGCPIHPKEILICVVCDLFEDPPLTDDEWVVLEGLLTRVGAMAIPYPQYGRCPTCGRPRLCHRCSVALEDQVWVPEDTLSAAEVAQLRAFLARVQTKRR
jgi:hypothetical protein